MSYANDSYRHTINRKQILEMKGFLVRNRKGYRMDLPVPKEGTGRGVIVGETVGADVILAENEHTVVSCIYSQVRVTV